MQITTAREEILLDDLLAARAARRTRQLRPARAGQGRRRPHHRARQRRARGGPRLHRRTVDRGARDGLEVGNVLAIYHPAPVIPDPRPYDRARTSFRRFDQRPTRDIAAADARILNIPPERSGLLFVFRVFDQVAYGDRAQYVGAGGRRRPGAQALAARLPAPRRWRSTRASRPGRRCNSCRGSRLARWSRCSRHSAARRKCSPRRRRGSPSVVPAETGRGDRARPRSGELEQTLGWLREPGHALVAWDDPAYPRALLDDRRSAAGALLRGRARAA